MYFNKLLTVTSDLISNNSWRS